MMSKDSGYFQDLENVSLESTTRSHAIDHMISMARFDYAEMKKILATQDAIKSPENKFVNLIILFFI